VKAAALVAGALAALPGVSSHEGRAGGGAELRTAPPDPDDIGTAHPIFVDRIATDGSWMVICQDRTTVADRSTVDIHGNISGGHYRPFLVLGHGPGLPIDEFLTASSRNDVVAVRRGRELQVISVPTQRVTGIAGAVLGNETSPSRRTVGFDEQGAHLLYVRQNDSRIVLRDLQKDREAAMDPGPGTVWRAQLDPAGRWAMADMLPSGGIAPVATDRRWSTCRAPGSFIVVPRPPGPQTVRRWARAGQRRMRPADGLIRPLERGLMVRTPTEAIEVVSESGSAVEVVPASCHGRVVSCDEAGKQLVVVCRTPGEEDGLLTLYDEGKPTMLGPTAVPADDLIGQSVRGLVEWDGLHVDVAKKQIVNPDADDPPVVTLVSKTGSGRGNVFAIRSDGAKLRPSWDQTPADDKFLLGPLRWFRPKR